MHRHTRTLLIAATFGFTLHVGASAQDVPATSDSSTPIVADDSNAPANASPMITEAPANQAMAATNMDELTLPDISNIPKIDMPAPSPKDQNEQHSETGKSLPSFPELPAQEKQPLFTTNTNSDEPATAALGALPEVTPLQDASPPSPADEPAAVKGARPPIPVVSVTAPPLKEMPVVADESSATTTATAPASTTAETAAPAKKRQSGKKGATAVSGIITPVRTTFYRNERLPAVIYKKQYDSKNRHLPTAMYEQEYDTLLFKTSSRDDLNGLHALLRTGRTVDQTNAAGETPLHAAAKGNAINTARLLLAKHANPNLPDARGITPMQIAQQQGNYSLVRAMQAGIR